MIKRLAGLLTGAVLALTGCGADNSGLPHDAHCGHSANGVLCMVVYAGNSKVRDVIGYYSPTTSLTGRTWRLDLLGYDCDPAGAACRPVVQYPTRARHAPPPVDGRCIAVLYDSGRQRCTNRLAAAYGSHADWAGLPGLPSAALAGHAWLCVSAQLAQRDRWHDQFARSAACYHHT